MPGQALVQKRVIRIQKLQHAAIFLEDAGEELLRLLPHRPA
jgi:hypothetical protein